MTSIIKQKFTSIFILFLLLNIHYFCGQNRVKQQSHFEDTISSIHPIEKAKNHYIKLQTLSSSKRSQYAWMNTIAYPPELYKNNTLLFALTKPEYLTSSQVGYLVKSMQFPANNSE